MNIAFMIVLLYVILLYGISWYSNKLNKEGGAIGYLLAGRGLPSYIVGVMVAGIAVGGASTVGVAERAYTQGLSAGMYNAAWAIGAIVVGLVAAARFRNLNITTIPELFGQYYDELGKIMAVIGQLIIQIVITSLQYVAGGAILTALLPNYFTFSTGMLTTAVVFVGIALIGGYWAAGLSNLINVIIIYIGITAGVVMSISEGGGLSNIVANLPSGSHWFDPISGVGFGLVAAWFVVMITQTFSTQAVVQISFAAEDDKAARNGFILGGLLILPIGFMSALFGIVAAAQFPGLEAAAMALPKVVLNLNVAVGGLTLAALWAADVSTAVGLLLGSSTLVVSDIWKSYIQPDMTEKQELVMSRVIVLAISVITYILAITVVGILKTLLIGLTLTTAYTIVLLFTLFAPKLCRKSSATWTLGVGTIFLVLWVFVPQIHIVSHPIFLEWPICLITFLLVSILDNRPANIPDKVSQ
jgi:SSS family solute:Na+ symporter